MPTDVPFRLFYIKGLIPLKKDKDYPYFYGYFTLEKLNFLDIINSIKTKYYYSNVNNSLKLLF